MAAPAGALATANNSVDDSDRQRAETETRLDARPYRPGRRPIRP